ncbi:MAG: hypothetical protein L7V85_07660 [Bacteroidia bacterium]|nr:hypothetical protein [Bacteroidia bacterium]
MSNVIIFDFIRRKLMEMSRDKIHNRIDELLAMLSIHNSRLSLHAEKLSQLDIDVFRKHCIDLYDEVNGLALKGKLKPSENKVVEKEEKTNQKSKTSIQEKVEKKKEKIKVNLSKNDNDEMLSLFEKYSNKPISSIAKGMSIAKRFEFQNVFFDGDKSDYNSFISEIDGVSNRDEAFKIYKAYKTERNWDQEELKDELKALIYRKYV